MLELSTTLTHDKEKTFDYLSTNSAPPQKTLAVVVPLDYILICRIVQAVRLFLSDTQPSKASRSVPPQLAFTFSENAYVADGRGLGPVKIRGGWRAVQSTYAAKFSRASPGRTWLWNGLLATALRTVPTGSRDSALYREDD